MTGSIDLTSQETGLKKCLGASLIRWRHTGVACMDFHIRGKARVEWDKLWQPKRDGVFSWDHVVRAQVTPKAQEFVLIKAYPTTEDFLKTKGLPYRIREAGYSNLIRTGYNLQDDVSLSPWMNTSPDYAMRLSIAGWRKHNGMCGRILCAFNCTAASDQEQWHELIDESHRQYGLREKHRLSNRIFHFFYGNHCENSVI